MPTELLITTTYLYFLYLYLLGVSEQNMIMNTKEYTTKVSDNVLEMSKTEQGYKIKS